MARQKITTFLWYDGKAEEAARFYVSLFKNSTIDQIVRGPGGSTLIVEFTIAGTPYIALNGGPMYTFTEAVSLSVDCDDQTEIDHLWNSLIADGGQPSRCGWLKDKYGLSWQIVPRNLGKLIADPKRGGSAMQAMMGMAKLNIAQLEAAGA